MVPMREMSYQGCLQGCSKKGNVVDIGHVSIIRPILTMADAGASDGQAPNSSAAFINFANCMDVIMVCRQFYNQMSPPKL